MYFFIHKNATIFHFFFTYPCPLSIRSTYLINLQLIIKSIYSGYSTLK